MLFKKDNAILSNFYNECTKSIYTHPRTAKKTYQITGLQMDVDNRSKIPLEK